MKYKKSSMKNLKYHQKALINDQTITEAAQNIILHDDRILIPMYCMKHKFQFFRHKIDNYGYCWYCKFETMATDKTMIESINGKLTIDIYPLLECHVIYSDSIRNLQN